MRKQDYFFIHKDSSYVKLRFQEILYVEACQNYVNVVTEKKSHLVLVSLNQMEQLLTEHSFCRVHRSFLVSLDHADCFNHETIIIKGKSIPIGNYYRNRLKDSVTIVVSETRNNGAVKIAKEYLVQKN